MATFQYGGPASMGKPTSMTAGPDTMSIGGVTYTNLNHADSLYGANGYDPSRALKSFDQIFGGGGGTPSYSYGGALGGGGGGTLGGGGLLGANNPAAHFGANAHSIGQGMSTLSGTDAGVDYRMREAMPYQTQLRQTQMQTQGQLQIAQMQARAQLAAQLLQAQIAREERMMMLQDNERNRMASLEQQRRNALADQYGTQQQMFYQYGLGV